MVAPSEGARSGGCRRSAAARGFTLLEVAVALAIAGLLAAMSIAGLERVLRRSRLATSGLDLATTVQLAQALSSSTGDRHVVLLSVRPTGGWAHIVRDRNRLLGPCLKANADWFEEGKFPDKTEAGADCAELAQRIERLETDARLKLGPAGGYKAVKGAGPSTCPSAFSAPYCNVPDDTPCTFCSETSEKGSAGAIAFEPRLAVRLYKTDGTEVSSAKGGSFVFHHPDVPQDARGVLVTRLGVVRAVGSPGKK